MTDGRVKCVCEGKGVAKEGNGGAGEARREFAIAKYKEKGRAREGWSPRDDSRREKRRREETRGDAHRAELLIN